MESPKVFDIRLLIICMLSPRIGAPLIRNTAERYLLLKVMTSFIFRSLAVRYLCYAVSR